MTLEEGKLDLLKADNLMAGYGQKTVLAAINLTVEQGKMTVLVGPNGSGKSTLLRCFAGALRLTSGMVTIGGSDLYRMPARQLARLITFVPQETPMPFAFTVAELVALSTGSHRFLHLFF